MRPLKKETFKKRHEHDALKGSLKGRHERDTFKGGINMRQ